MPNNIGNHRSASVKELPLSSHFPVQQSDLVELRMLMLQSLQTSLDPERILTLFCQHLQSLLPLQGLRYHNQASACELLVGREASHKVSYRLKTTDDDLGELVFSRSKRFSNGDMALLESLMGLLICPLRNALQYRNALQSALIDPLTQVGNRIALERSLQRELLIAERQQQPLSLLAIDIDHFKRINDNYGHACGDQVLQAVTSSITSVIRGSDMIFRYGGEEFVVLLTNTPAEGAMIIAQRIRQFIENKSFVNRGNTLKTTVSIGISSLDRDDCNQSLFDRADAALYKAKKHGRNRVESSN